MILALAWCAFVGIHAVPAAASGRFDPHCLLQSRVQRSSSLWEQLEVEDRTSAGFFEFYTFSTQRSSHDAFWTDIASWTANFERFANALTQDLSLSADNPWLPSGCEVFMFRTTDEIATKTLKHLPPLSETSGPGRVVLVLNEEHQSGEEVWALLQPELRAQDKVVILGNKWNATHANLEDGRVSSLWVPCASLLFVAHSKSTPMDLVSAPPSRAVYNTVAYQQHDCNPFREQVWDRLNEMLDSEFQVHGAQLSTCNGDNHAGVNMSGVVPDGSHEDWDTSVNRLASFKFALTAENDINNDIGYISEKIIDALLAGIVPIYAGSLDILQMINPDRFILLKGDETDEEQLRLVMALVQDPIRYAAMRSKPAIVSDEAMRQFFSWHPSVWPRYGDSLRQRIVGSLARQCKAST
ncbi:unnamed protein product [Polarella glacialis]|uniref:Fucosyltransferase n=2 Tax=Polarella glacialis TaxID=89957 RepID=A0A813LGJ0_POLGL|nr:unnamed protein product [Polarella glacialis]